MPRKKAEELKSNGGPGKAAPVDKPAPKPAAAAPKPAAAPEVSYSMKEDAAPAASMGGWHPADTNGDGHVSAEEEAMYLEFKRKELEDQDAMRDAQRKMSWFALFGMLLYPFAVVLATWLSLEQAASVLGSMAATYFVSVAAIVMAFFGAQAYTGKGKK